jgi:NTE family protein
MSNKENIRDIALALSGGGYRAAYFHLGVLEKLHELDLLKRVGVVSSVSGGSILAGIYATTLLNGDSFESFSDQSRRFLGKVMPLDWPVLLQDAVPWGTSSKGLERNFERIFKNKNGQPITMNDLKAMQPHFVINATAVHSGAGWRFRPGGTAEHWEMGHTHDEAFQLRFIEYECNVTLGKAVAASTAFPTFSSVTIPSEEIRETGVKSAVDPEIATIVPQLPHELPDVLSLSDGGVLDNTGITSILSGAFPTKDTSDYYLVASDAGGVVPVLRKPPHGRLRKLKYVLRQFDLRGGHNNTMTSFLALRYHRREIKKGFAMININEAAVHAGETLEEVSKLTSIKTRLKRLPGHQREGLMQHGANLVWSRVSEYMPELLTPESRMTGTVPRKAADG